MPKASDFTRAGFTVSHALVASCKRPKDMSDHDIQWRLQEIAHAIYHAKLEFLGKMDELAQEAMGLALVEKVKGSPSDEEMLQCDAFKLIRQGVVRHANVRYLAALLFLGTCRMLVGTDNGAVNEEHF